MKRSGSGWSLLCVSLSIVMLGGVLEAGEDGFHPLGGTEPSAACAKGCQALLAGDLVKAEASFDDALKGKNESSAHYGMGLLHWMRGDEQQATEQFALAVRHGTRDPWSEGYLLSLSGSAQACRDPKLFLDVLTALVDDDKARPRMRDMAAFHLSRWMLMSGQWEKARSYLARLQYLRSWQLIGPFANRDESGMAKAYGPEHEIDLTQPVDGRHRRVKWFRCAAEPQDGVVDLSQVFEPNTHSLAYALTHVKVAKSQWAVLHAGSGGACKVWLNGRDVLAITDYNTFAEEKKAVPVYLHEGCNQILVKVAAGETAEWSFALRLSRPEGGPLPGLAVLATAEALKAYRDSSEGRTTPLLEPGTPELGLLPRVDAALRTSPDHPWLRAWRGALLNAWRIGDLDDTDAAEEYQKAAQRYPKCPLFMLELAQAADDVNVARQAAEHCSTLFPDLPLSWSILAGIAAQAGFEPMAEAYARDGLAKFGADRAGVCATELAKILIRRGQRAEAERLIRAFLKAHPFSPEGWRLLARTAPGRSAQRKIVDQALKRCGGDVGLRGRRSAEMILGHKEEDAARFLEEDLWTEPFAVSRYMQVASAWRRAGQADKALAVLTSARKVAPENSALLAALGTELLRSGKAEEAVAIWREALRIKPDSPRLKDWLAEAGKGEAIDRSFFATYDVALKDLPQVKREDYPNDHSVTLLNQEVIHVNPNGSASRMVHRVAKLLRSDGAAGLSRQRIFYEPGRQTIDILRAAVITPSGAETSRARITDRTVSAAMGVETRIYDEHHLKEIVFQGLEPGSIVDFQYILRDTGGNIYGDFFSDSFYFGDDQPVLKSQYVLDLPKTREFQMRSFRAPLEPRRAQSKDPEREVFIWEGKDFPGVVQEARMPPLMDQIPFVQTTTMRSWSEVGKWYWNLSREQLTVDDNLRALAREIAGDAQTPTEKLRAVHDWVIKKIRYLGIEFGRNGYKPHRASETYKALYGDCKDTAALICTLLKSLDIEARMVLVRTTQAGKIEEDALPAPNLFNHAIAYVPDVEGEDYWIDGTTDYHQLGEVPFTDQGAQVLVVGPDGGRFMQIPHGTPEENHNEVRIQARVNKNGSGTLAWRRVYRGQVAPYYREQADTPGTFRSALQAQAAKRFPGAELVRIAHAKPNDRGAMWIETDFKIPNLASRSGDRLALTSAADTFSLSKRFLSGGERRHDLQLWFPFSRTNEVVYHLDAGLRPVGLPEKTEIKEPFASYTRNVTVEGQMVRITEEFSLNTSRIPKKQYVRFSEFCHNVDALQTQKVLLQPQ